MNSRILAIMAIIVAGLVFYFYIDPTYSIDIALLKSQIASDTQAHAAALDYTQHATLLERAKSSIAQSDLDRLNTLLPDAVNNVQVILDLNTVAEKSGLILSGINVLNPNATVATAVPPSADGSSAASSLGSVDIQMVVSGTYDSFRTFLAQVQKSLRVLDIRSLAVKGSDNRIYTYNMTIRLYWLR